MFPRWLSWLFVLVMVYLIYAASGYHAVDKAPASSVVPPITKENYPALAEMTDAERWKRKLNPDYAATHQCELGDQESGAAKSSGALTLKMVEDVAGAGDGAQCGDTITVHLTVWNASGGKAYDGEFPLALGSRELAAGIDAGLVGIKVGGQRTLTIPPTALVRGKKGDVPAAVLKAMPTGKLAVVSVKRVE